MPKFVEVLTEDWRATVADRDRLRDDVEVWKQGHTILAQTLGTVRAENARLRKALQEIMVVRLSHLRSSQMQAAMHSMRDIARAALDKEDA